MSTTDYSITEERITQIASLDYTAEDTEDFLRALIEPQRHLLEYKNGKPIIVDRDYWGRGTPAIKDAITKVYTQVQQDPEAMPDVLPELGQNAMPYLTAVARNMRSNEDRDERTHTRHLNEAAIDPSSPFFQEPVWDEDHWVF